MSSALLYTHCKNYMANRTTNERFSKKAKKVTDANKTLTTSEDPDESALTSSILTMSDFDNSSLIESVVDEGSDKEKKKKYKRNKRRGCCINCWKMATHTKIVPQTKLYNYLAE
jgi:pyocin large subunit-like protein